MDVPELPPSPPEPSGLDPKTMHPYALPASQIARVPSLVTPTPSRFTERNVITPDGLLIRRPENNGTPEMDDFDETTAEPKWVVEAKASWARENERALPKLILSKNSSLSRQEPVRPAKSKDEPSSDQIGSS